MPLSALTRADGWILVPAESEGYSAGAPVSVFPLP
jgi:molybdopterin biosynthesis enzyme